MACACVKPGLGGRRGEGERCVGARPPHGDKHATLGSNSCSLRSSVGCGPREGRTGLARVTSPEVTSPGVTISTVPRMRRHERAICAREICPQLSSAERRSAPSCSCSGQIRVSSRSWPVLSAPPPRPPPARPPPRLRPPPRVERPPARCAGAPLAAAAATPLASPLACVGAGAGAGAGAAAGLGPRVERHAAQLLLEGALLARLRGGRVCILQVGVDVKLGLLY